MNIELLRNNARALVREGRGILAADESAASCQKRFDAVNVPCTEETRREYRELLITAGKNDAALSGVIFYDETFWQSTSDGKPFREYLNERGILPGIKVDLGLVDLPGFPGEKVSKGLDDLPERLEKYRDAGAKFAKWRSVIAIGEGIPTDECIGANTYVLARYARLCQEYDIVPIVEPEVLFDGTHTIEDTERVLARTLDILFATMRAFRVDFGGAILKTAMVLPGKESESPIVHEDVAARTVGVLHAHVPSDLGGVVFLSGGQTPDDAFNNLNAMAAKGPHPWGMTFSFSRALQDPVLKYWAAHREDKEGAKRLFDEQLGRGVASREGKLEFQATNDAFVSHGQDL